ncbi:MAG: hypothetical protein RBR77_15535 [Thauera sp.]|jgi:hypothetical protein|nr:hypothetical protein [Thauera sp.]
MLRSCAICKLRVDFGHAHHGAAVDFVDFTLLEHAHQMAHGAHQVIGPAFALGLIESAHQPGWQGQTVDAAAVI